MEAANIDYEGRGPSMKGEEKYAELSMEDKDPFIRRLHQVIRIGVKILALLMVLVIMWGIVDVVWVVFERLREPPYFLLT